MMGYVTYVMSSRTPLQRLLEFDDVRAFKLLEIVQYMMLAVIVSIFAASFVDQFFDQVRPPRHTGFVIFLLLLEVAVLGVTLYYVKKTVYLVPFLGKPLVKLMRSSYVPDRKNEDTVGITVGVALSFGHAAINLNRRILQIRELFGKKKK